MNVGIEERDVHDHAIGQGPCECLKRVLLTRSHLLRFVQHRDERCKRALGETAQLIRAEAGVYAIDDECFHVDVSFGQFLNENGGVIDCVVAGNSYKNKRCGVGNEEIVNCDSAAAESFFHAIERGEKLDGVINDRRADDASNDAKKTLRCEVHDASETPGWCNEHFVEAVIEKVRDAIGSFEKINCVARRGSVDDHEIETVVVVEFVQLLHRHVFVRARH